MTQNNIEPVVFAEGEFVCIWEKDPFATKDILTSSDGRVVFVDENMVVVQHSSYERYAYAPRASDGEYVRIAAMSMKIKEGQYERIAISGMPGGPAVLRKHGDRDGIWKVVFGLSESITPTARVGACN
jgi:hypothetical protein